MTQVGASGCYDGPEHPIVHIPRQASTSTHTLKLDKYGI